MAEEDDDMRGRNRFKENAGVATAMLVVGAFVGIGYSKIVEALVTGRGIEVPDDWMAAMLSLASAAIGYLFGRGRSSSPVGYTQSEYDAALATPPPDRSPAPCVDPPCQDAPPRPAPSDRME